MSKYKVDIAGFNEEEIVVLKNSETIELFKQFREGVLSAKEKIVQGNLKLVLSLTNKFRHKNMDLNDLFQAGCIGLIKAVDNFDLKYNVMFSTYAVPLILGEIKRVVRQNNSSLHISRSTRDLAYKILSFKEDYYNNYGIEPSNEVIAKSLEIDEYEIDYALKSLDKPLSIFMSKNSDDDITLGDQIPDLNDLNQDKDALIMLRESLKEIKDNEKKVITERYFLGLTQSEIADSLNVSQAQVSRIEKNAIKTLKKKMN